MGKFEDGCYGSLKGIALIAKVLAGRCPMHYTRVAVGKGCIPEDMTPKTVDVPPDYVMDAMISAVSNPIDGECQVSVQLNSANVEAGFYATGLLLYAEDPDEGEVPYTYLCLENEPEWIRPSSSIVGKLAHFDIIAAVGDVDMVTATIDPNAFATLEAVRNLLVEHGRDSNTHADIRIAIETVKKAVDDMAIRRLDLTIPVEGWTETGEGTYPCRLEFPVEDVAASAIPELTVLPGSTGAAARCGLAPFAETGSEVLRLWAERVPEQPIQASLTLLRDASGLCLADGTPLPPATEDRIGAVKPGPGLSVGPDGTLAVNSVSPEELRDLLGRPEQEV